MRFQDQDKIDLIIITHEHSDHFEPDLIIELQKKTDALVLTTPFVAQKLKKMKTYVKPLKVGDSFILDTATFCAEHSNHPANQPLSFVVCNEIATIYHPNDSRPFPEMSLIARKHSPDIMIYTGNLIGAIPEIVDLIKPGLIVTYPDPRLKHIDMPGVAVKALKPGEISIYPDVA